ncbi:MAG: ribosomal protein S18-alanine N-acetyltransferase [Kiloniellales bacterium]
MTAAGIELRRAGPPEAVLLAALHAACFPQQPWDEAAMTGLLASPGSFALLALRGGQPLGFALGRVMADEAEILSLGVLPERRRQGAGRALAEALSGLAANLGARVLHLEVAADNAAAQALYRALGFEASGRRRRYYRDGPGPAVDALLLRRHLSQTGTS